MTGITQCGFIGIIGAPNAGKSTLLNRMIGMKLAITSPRVQTTRNRILGVYTKDNSQLVFHDTPGIFDAKAEFERAMVQAALTCAAESDIILLIVDAHRGVCQNTQLIISQLSTTNARIVLILNKTDITVKYRLPALVDLINKQVSLDRCFMVSAHTGDGVQDLLRYLLESVPEGAWHYPEDTATDVPWRQLAAEITREKLFYALREELPYQVHVETEQWDERADGSVAISQVIYVTRESQKIIIIGHKGSMLKEIGQKSRMELSRLQERPVHLKLFIKVNPDWKSQGDVYQSLGLSRQNS